MIVILFIKLSIIAKSCFKTAWPFLSGHPMLSPRSLYFRLFILPLSYNSCKNNYYYQTISMQEENSSHPHPVYNAKKELHSHPSSLVDNSKEDPRLHKFREYWYILEQKIHSYGKVDNNHINQIKIILERSIDDPTIDRAFGAIYGAMIGDALGAYCQFQHKLLDKTVEEAMEMNGGGTFGLEAGQFTDDSEMAASLLRGLEKFDENKPLESQSIRLICNIGLEYWKWYQSGPFDIGNTCRGGIYSIKEYFNDMQVFSQETEEKPEFLDDMFKDIYSYNKTSLANGSLMRISPQAFFFALSGEKPLKHAQFIKDEIRLTHPAQQLGEAGLFWVQLLTDLINRKDSSAQTFRQIYYENQSKEEFGRLKSWFEEAQREKEDAMPGNHNMGHAKIAFSYGLRILNYLAKGKQNRLDENLYIDWMSWIIKRAGDTDTNAAIAGGLLGSIIGFWRLPSKYVVRTLMTVTDRRNFKLEGDYQQPKVAKNSKYGSPKRPFEYQPSYVFLSALNMVKKCEDYKKKFIYKN